MLRALGMNVWSLTRDQAKGRNFQSYPSKGKAVFTRIKKKERQCSQFHIAWFSVTISQEFVAGISLGKGVVYLMKEESGLDYSQSLAHGKHSRLKAQMRNHKHSCGGEPPAQCFI